MTSWQLVLRKVPAEREPRASFRDEFQPRFDQAARGLERNALEPNAASPRPLRPVAVSTGWQGTASKTVASRANEAGGQSPLRALIAACAAALSWLNGRKPSARRMRLTETISLGEKRFVSILQVDGKQILIGSSAGNVSMLAILDGKQDGITAARTALEQVA
jgi:hypothetical protein